MSAPVTLLFTICAEPMAFFATSALFTWPSLMCFERIAFGLMSLDPMVAAAYALPPSATNSAAYATTVRGLAALGEAC